MMRSSIMQKVLLLVLIAACATQTALAACPYKTGNLVNGEDHGVSGKLTIKKSCTLKVDNFKYDGQAPKVYWWAAPSCNYIDIVKNGHRISNARVSKQYKGTDYSVMLNSGVTLKKAGCIVLYCESFRADLGHVRI